MFRVDFELNTVMWNEGFEEAEYPWLRLYTDNAQWVKSLDSREFAVDVSSSYFDQGFDVKVVQVPPSITLPDSEQLEWEESYDDEHADDVADNQPRFQGKLLGLSAADLDKIVDDRLKRWGGI